MAVELDINVPLAVVFVCANRKEQIKKQSEQIRLKVEERGFQVVEEFQALTFPKESNLDKVFIEAFSYLFNNKETTSTLFLIAEPVLPEDSLSSYLCALLRSQLGVDVYYAIDYDSNETQSTDTEEQGYVDEEVSYVDDDKKDDHEDQR